MQCADFTFQPAFMGDGYWFGGYGVRRHGTGWGTRPGFYAVTMLSEGHAIAQFFTSDDAPRHQIAVVDDFGNLVRVQ